MHYRMPWIACGLCRSPEWVWTAAIYRVAQETKLNSPELSDELQLINPRNESRQTT